MINHNNKMSHVWNISVKEVDDTSPLAAAPKNLKIQLKPHQLAALQKCYDLESKEIAIDNDTNMRTKVGVIGDEVGSGKSFVILSLVVSDNPIPQTPSIQTHGENKIVVTSTDSCVYQDLNLLVIPHNLCSQWESYIQSFSEDLKNKYIMVTKKKEYNHFVECDLSRYNLVIVTCTYYNTLVLELRRRKYRIRRVIYDEVDSMNIQSCAEVDSMFYWFVTASYGNLLYPKSCHYFDRTLQKYTILATGMRHSGFLKNLFVDICDFKHVRSLIVKNNSEFIKSSFELPEIVYKFIKCKASNAVHILHGVVDRGVLECLNAGDIPSAIRLVKQSCKNTEENIIDIIISNLNKQLGNLDLRLQYTRMMTFDSDEAKQHEIERLEASKHDIQSKISHIKDRIKNTNMCCICFDDIKNKTVLSCCSNTYCFKCINIWLSKSHHCPLCKTIVDKDSIYVIQELDSQPEPIMTDQMQMQLHESNNKMTNLLNILSSMDNTHRVLIFSGYDTTLDNIWKRVLHIQQMPACYLKGNRASIDKIIRDYRSGMFQILLVNSRDYGSGMNLENTTDIIMFHKFENDLERQVIGRAQRAGRTQPLRVWYLLHENEWSEDYNNTETN